MARKIAGDSLQGKINSAIAKERVYLPAEDMAELVGDELSVWNQYISSRFDWQHAELRIVHKIVKLESLYRKLTLEALDIPAFYEKSSGDLAPHPIHSEIRQTHKAIQMEVRSLGISHREIERKFSGAAGSTRGKKTPSKMSLVG